MRDQHEYLMRAASSLFGDELPGVESALPEAASRNYMMIVIASSNVQLLCRTDDEVPM